MSQVNQYFRYKELLMKKEMGKLSLREKVELFLIARRLPKEQRAGFESEAKRAAKEQRAEQYRLRTDYKYALDKTGRFHAVERVPYGKVIVDMRREGDEDVINAEVIDRFYPNAPDFALVELMLGYLDVLEKYGLETAYVEAPFNIKHSPGIFSKRDPYDQRQNIIDMLNAALSVRGMYYDGYAMRKLP